MKTEYLRHEYTWSNHCITGNTLGWGITASSTIKDKRLLKELEKVASSLEPDRGSGIPVEELVYSPDCGFVKMIAVPCEAGEDNRNNKRVCLYQPKERETDDPAVYLAPDAVWNPSESEFLSPVELNVERDSCENILIKMNLYDRLPDFFRVVFLCLFEKKQSLNIVVPFWKKEEFADGARKLMYVIHSMLPTPIRKKAGYVSYTEQALHRVPFYFSQEACGEKVLNLDTFYTGLEEDADNPLEEYFFYHLAEFYVKKDPLFDRFMERAAQYFTSVSDSGNELGKLEWLFYGMCQKEGKECLNKQTLVSRIPELVYWASKNSMLKETAEEILDTFHHSSWNIEEEKEYIHILLEGFTKRAQKVICNELRWVLECLWAENRESAREEILFIREKNKFVYGLLLTENYDKKGTFSNEIFEEAVESFDGMNDYVDDLEKVGIPSLMKDQLIMKGIGLLNENLFEKERYVIFDQIIGRLNREDQWKEILKDFVEQLEAQAEEFENGQLETACYVEQLLKKYAPKEVKGVLMEERRRRAKEEFPKETEQDEALFVPVEEEEENGSFLDFFLGLVPHGFLTGCSLYLSSYSLMIGHWKIAVGMAGIWIILMLNYYSMMLYKEKRYPFWKNLGGCIIMGYIIETVASMIISQKLRLYYFIILGGLTVLVQGAGIIRKKLGKEE